MKKTLETLETKKTAWNKGKAVGQMKPFTQKQVAKIKYSLFSQGKYRDLALFSLGIDTMLRSSDLLALKVMDISNGDGSIKSEFNIKQKKTGKNNLVSISEKTKEVLKKWIEDSKKEQDAFLFTGLKRKQDYLHLSHKHYTKLVKEWVVIINQNPKEFSTHSIRRTKAAYIYEKTNNIEVVRQLLGQNSVTSTSFYLNINKRKALDIAKGFEI